MDGSRGCVGVGEQRHGGLSGTWCSISNVGLSMGFIWEANRCHSKSFLPTGADG